MRNIVIIGGVAALLLIVGSLWSRAFPENDTSVLTRSGLHWHPALEIYVGDKKVEMPQNIGLGAVHKPVHTHDDLPIIHLEFNGTVREEDAMLGEFFENWAKDMRSFGENMRMTVNGVPNAEFERYIMRDKDKIELHYD